MLRTGVRMGLVFHGPVLVQLRILDSRTPLKTPKAAFAAAVREQLLAYAQDPEAGFDVVKQAQGTAFQLRVWQALEAIPAGVTLTYGELARRLKTSPRAIGAACRNNPIPVIVPCHRVVASNGDGGYMGKTTGREVNVKQWLLAHERR